MELIIELRDGDCRWALRIEHRLNGGEIEVLPTALGDALLLLADARREARREAR